MASPDRKSRFLRTLSVVTVGSGLLLSGCGDATIEPTPTNFPATYTPEPTATLSPTDTPMPTVTPYPSETATPAMTEEIVLPLNTFQVFRNRVTNDHIQITNYGYSLLGLNVHFSSSDRDHGVNYSMINCRANCRFSMEAGFEGLMHNNKDLQVTYPSWNWEVVPQG